MMKWAIFTALLAGFVAAAPTSNQHQLIVTEEFFTDQLAIYHGQHDIVKIFVPINSINFEEDDSVSDEDDVDDVILFFVEADIKDGEVTEQGLYVRKGGVANKLLDNGRDADAPKDNSTLAFFAAKDGIYKYNATKNEAEKYGTLDDDLKSLACGNSSEYLYILTKDKEIYKVTDNGTKKVKVDGVTNAEQFVMDMSNNLFYLNSENKLFVINDEGVKEIALPETGDKITLIKPIFVYEAGIPIVVDTKTYSVYANGTVEQEPFVINLNSPITAYSVEATLVQYYAHNKNIYEYNLLYILIGQFLNVLREFLQGIQADIQSIATRSRSEFVNSR